MYKISKEKDHLEKESTKSTDSTKVEIKVDDLLKKWNCHQMNDT